MSRYKARRLVYTETSYFNACSSLQSYKDLGIERIEIIEALDFRTCETCGGLGGTVIPLAQYEPGVTVPPFHPNCRGTTAPYYDDMDGERAARNAEGKVYYVPANMKFTDWKKTFVDGGAKDGLTVAVVGAIIKSTFKTPDLLAKHYEKHRAEFDSITAEEYLEMANQLAVEKLSEDVEQLVRSDESISKYKFSTNEFLVITKDGPIRTYFKPIDREKYWRDEHERNQD